MDDSYRYMVYRKYSKKERPSATPSERIVFYGWTRSKDIIKAFTTQRDKNKYKVVKVYDDDLDRSGSKDADYALDDELAIDFIVLPIASNKETVTLFVTSRELSEYNKKIQRYFSELSSIARIPGDGDYFNILINLKQIYLDALSYLGYQPEELNLIDIDPLYYDEDSINQVNSTYKVDDRVLFSLESFIKVMSGDL